MHRHASYSYSHPATAAASATHRYSGTSSAFSASANPNEDWTKISDLAERRRIQNRIAQRNYRKKLKKRLEDLERRAASNSASPEQRPAELSRPNSQNADDKSTTESTSDPADSIRKTPDIHHSHYLSTQDDSNMFSHQYTRQLSTSPPPLSYSTYPSETVYAPYTTQHASYPSIHAVTSEVPQYQPYLPPLSSNSYHSGLPSMMYPQAAKQEYYASDEMSPFSMSYASMAGIDIPVSQAYQDSNAHVRDMQPTPPLSESFDHSAAGSPPESAQQFPTTPASLPGTPPLRLL